MKFNLPLIQNDGVAAWLAMVDRILPVPDGLPALAATTIIEGKIVLYLHPTFNHWSDGAKADCISHECGHVVLEHIQRRCQIEHDHMGEPHSCERDARLFNMCTDAVLHHNEMFANLPAMEAEISIQTHEVKPGEGWDFLASAYGIQGGGVLAGFNGRVVGDPPNPGETLRIPFRGSNFERLGVPPCRAEIAYDMLVNNQSDKIKVVSCGSMLLSKCDGSRATKELLDKIGIEVVPHLQGASTTGGPPMPITGTIPDPPAWIKRVIPFLVESVNRANRGRSWRRFSRTEDDLMPGRERVADLTGQVFIDQSGSCDQYVPLFLAAVCSTPELAGLRVYTFDDEVRGPLPANDMAGVRALLESSRGGTLIAKAGKLRESGVPVVWLTDAESGDGLPPIHDGAEIWCCVGNAPTPGRMRIEIDG